MYEPVRGGTRGGQAEFKWSDVSADKDREHYLGHSINAPTGRWQKNKDIHWYARDKEQTQAERDEEIRRIKEAEAEALAAALGFASGSKPGASNVTGGPGTGANAVAVPFKDTPAVDALDPDKVREKDERRRRKAERKEEKRLKKEAKRARKHAGEDSDDERRRRRDSRSASPRRGSRERSRPYEARGERNRERTPPVLRGEWDYDERERERERERRWEDNERLGARRGRD